MENLQHHGNNSQEFPVAGKLLSVIYLLPPRQSIVDPLVFSKWCPFLPMEEVVSDLKQRTLLSIILYKLMSSLTSKNGAKERSKSF